jgi:PKD repeat protein
MPYGDVVGCQSGEYPNEDPADPMVSTLSHEENETMTDPLGNARWDASQFENGDECAYIYGTPLGGTGIGTLDLFNQMINRDAYYLQGEYSNRVGNCVWSNTFPSPTTSFTSSSDPTVNVAVKFTGKASETGTTSFTFRWSFGDGKTATGRTPSHTFTKAGKFQVKMVAFDSHGDSGRSTRTITIASS